MALYCWKRSKKTGEGWHNPKQAVKGIEEEMSEFLERLWG